MDKGKKKHSLLWGMLLFVVLTVLIFSVVHKMDPQIWQVLTEVSLGWIALLLGLSMVYQLMEGLIYRRILGKSLPGFRLQNGLDVSYIGVFSFVAMVVGGKIPMQSLYLHKKGMAVSHAVGLLSVAYLFHKVTVLLWATVYLLADWGWIAKTLPGLASYLPLAYGACIAVIVGLLLICTWGRVKQGALWLIAKLPDTGKWPERKQHWSEHITLLYENTQSLMKDRTGLWKIFLLEVAKLAALYAAPGLCAWILGLGAENAWHILGLSGLMFLFSNVLPNVAGMGSVEVSFFLVFSQLFGESTLSVLLLYRIGTYYLPFFFFFLWMVAICRGLRQK